MKKKITVMLLDDHQFILSGMENMLSHDDKIQLIGGYTRSKELLAAFSHIVPNVFIMDYSLEPDDKDGFFLVRSIKEKFNEVKILVVSANNNSAIAAQCFRYGASGFLGKERCPPSTFIEAVKTVASGKFFFLGKSHDTVPNFSVVQNDELCNSPATISWERLTPKEIDVIRCFVTGMTVTEISEKFNRSLKTVSGQKQSALRKLGLNSDHQLFLITNELGKAND